MKILVALDFSAASETVIQEVIRRPWPAGARVEVLSVGEEPHLFSMSEVALEIGRRGEELVQQAAERLRVTGLEVTSLVLDGNPKSVIVDHARSTGADLVVVGPHGASGLTQFLLGSVARAVIRTAPCSVEIARVPASLAAERRGMKILLATDGTESSKLAVQSIAGRPWPAGTEVRVLSAVELKLSNFQAWLEPAFLGSAEMEKIREEGMKRAQDAIREAEEILTAAGLRVLESISVLVESPKKIILEEAERWGADMIVVGSHGRRGIDRFLLGSVSEAVAIHAGCSVEVIRRSPQ
jgi:nucleotide-binding universal stress UspA family protein